MTTDAVSAVSVPDLQPGQRFRPHSAETRAAFETMLVCRSDVGMDRHGRPYLRLDVRTVDGRVRPARWWRYPYPPDRRPRIGQVCEVSAALDRYEGNEQLRILAMRPSDDAQLGEFVTPARRPLAELLAELDARIGGLDAAMAALVRAVLAGEVAERFAAWPAAQTRLGAVRHGLLDHSLRVAALAERLADAYAPRLSYDAHLVAAGCLLHDVGKVYTLPEIPGTPMPDSAEVADHVTRGVLLVHAANTMLGCPVPTERMDKLTHAILSHHGRKEWGAPVEPHTLEACLLHLADYAESRLWQWCERSPP